MKDIKQNNAGIETQENLLPHHELLLFLKKQNVSVYLVAGGLVLVLAAFLFYMLKTNRDNEQACRMLGLAQNPQQFEELIRQYPKSTTAPVALLALASTDFSAGNYDAALEHYVEFAEKYPRHSMISAAELGKVMCSEARGETEKALAEFDAFLKTYPDHFLTSQALFGKARCLQLTGKLAEARIIYEDFIAAHPESKWRPNAESALQSLDRQMRLIQHGQQKK